MWLYGFCCGALFPVMYDEFLRFNEYSRVKKWHTNVCGPLVGYFTQNIHCKKLLLVDISDGSHVDQNIVNKFITQGGERVVVCSCYMHIVAMLYL